MLIDWFTVIAQVINFIILMWLLKRYLYKPILNAIDEREQKISNQLKDAEQQKVEAQKEQQHYETLYSDLETNRETLLGNAEAKAETQRQQLLDKAMKEYEHMRRRLKESLKNQQMNLSQEIIRRTQAEVFEIARKVLADLADTSLESQMANVFIQKIQTLNEEEKKQLLEAVESAHQPVMIRSVFRLPARQQDSIKKTIKELFGANAKVQFQTAPDEIGGIEIFTNGFKMEWTINSYLDSLEGRMAGLVESQLEVGTPPTKEAHGT